MKRTLKSIGAIIIMGIMLTCAYLVGTAHTGDTMAEKWKDNYVDMRTVIEFTAVGDGLYTCTVMMGVDTIGNHDK